MNHQQMQATPSTLGRTQCYRCDKPQPQCLCGHICRVRNLTAITVLQHPRERRHPLGTVRFLRLGLTRLHLQVCWDLRARQPVRDAAVLYPSKQAANLADDAPGNRPKHLIVLDGTWHQANKLYQANPWLAQLPHYAIRPDPIDRYRIRREPAPHCTSTLEAVVQALKILEPDTAGLDALLTAFEAMIDAQVAHVEQSTAPCRRGKRRRHRAGPVPPAWHRDPQALILLHAEYLRVKTPSSPRQLFYVAAFQPALARTFVYFLRPIEAAVSAEQLAHMGLDAEALNRAGDLQALRQAWQAFAPPAARLLAWSTKTLDLAGLFADAKQPRDLLKGVYCNIRHQRCGHVEDVVARHALVVKPVAVPGRASRRLACAHAILNWLLAL